MRPVNSPSFFYPKPPVAAPETEQSLLSRPKDEGTSSQPAKKEGPTFLNRPRRPTANLLSVFHEGNTPLHKAIKQGDFVAFGSLLAKTSDPDSLKNNSGKTPFSYAAEIGHLDMVNALLANPNVKPYAVDNDGRTPLSYAAENGHLDIVNEIVKALQETQADPHLPDKNGRTPLSYAAENGHFDIVNALLAAQANPNLPDKNGRTPISYAAENGHVDAVRALLENADTLPDMRGPDGKTPLHHAAANNHSGVVDLLLKDRLLRVDPNLSDTNGITPLASAAVKGQVNTVKILLKDTRVDPNLADDKGYTPLHHAVKNSYWLRGLEDEPIIEALLENDRLNPNLQEKQHSSTALGYAAVKGHFNTVKILLKDTRVDPNLADDKGYTPLHHTVKNSYWLRRLEDEKIIGALLENDRLTPNLQENEHGYTALAWAVLKNNSSFFKRLLGDQRVEVNLPDNEGRTPFFLATTCTDESTFDALLSHASVEHHKPANNGKTAFDNMLDGPIGMSPRRKYVISMLQNERVRQGIDRFQIMEALARINLEPHERIGFGFPQRQFNDGGT